MNIPSLIGIDIGGTKTAVVRGTHEGAILWRRQFPTDPGRGFRPTFDQICSVVQEARTPGADIEALSVSIGGPLDILEGIIQGPPNLPGWMDIPLKQLLQERFGLPVFIEHDGNAGALAEFFFGSGRGFKNIVFLTMGTGFGAGLILDGRLYRGTSDVAGEVGHIRIAEDGPDAYGKAGSLEGFASGPGISKLALSMFPGLFLQGVTPAELSERARRGEEEAQAVLNRAALYLGRGLAMIADMLNPQRIIVGGIGMRMFDLLVQPAVQVFRAEALPKAFDACAVVPAQLGESIGDLASLCAALDQMRPH